MSLYGLAHRSLNRGQGVEYHPHGGDHHEYEGDEGDSLLHGQHEIYFYKKKVCEKYKKMSLFHSSVLTAC
jgi:hypothetical protein